LFDSKYKISRCFGRAASTIASQSDHSLSRLLLLKSNVCKYSGSVANALAKFSDQSSHKSFDPKCKVRRSSGSVANILVNSSGQIFQSSLLPKYKALFQSDFSFSICAIILAIFFVFLFFQGKKFSF
jgi:hypothetical protein